MITSGRTEIGREAGKVARTFPRVRGFPGPLLSRGGSWGRAFPGWAWPGRSAGVGCVRRAMPEPTPSFRKGGIEDWRAPGRIFSTFNYYSSRRDERVLITIFVHVDFQTLLQPTRSALVSVRLVHGTASLEQNAEGHRPRGLGCPGAGTLARSRVQSAHGPWGTASPGPLSRTFGNNTIKAKAGWRTRGDPPWGSG